MDKQELKASIILEQLGLVCYLCKSQLQVKSSIYESPMENSEFDGIMLMKKRHICKSCSIIVEKFMDEIRNRLP